MKIKQNKETESTKEQIVLSDMESDGVYFSDEIKQELIKKKEELHCAYSDLPSVKSYEI
jgi:hypothetical protein